MNYLPERDLLVLLLQKEHYHNYIDFVDKAYLKDNFKELAYIYSCLDEIHSILPDDVEIAGLQAYFFQKYPDVDKDIYLELFKTLSEEPINPTLGVALLKSIKQRKQALMLSEVAFKFSSGNADYEKVVLAWDSLSEDKADTLEEFEFVTTSLTSIIHEIFKKPGLRWRLDALNKSLGSLRKGNFGFLFARPEVGKTTFLASEISYMLEQLPDDAGPIIWFNNEQVGAEVMLRMYQGYFGVRLEQIKSNPQKYEEEFDKRTRGKFKLVDNATIDKYLVERMCKTLLPSLVVFDQIDKIKGFKDDRKDLELGAIYTWARELAKMYSPVIGVCQAGGSGENVKWLTMDNVDNAKTSKQAEADWILGIGYRHEEGAQFIRYLHLSKNKLPGDDDTIGKLRHGKLEVMIEPEIARFKDIIQYG